MDMTYEQLTAALHAGTETHPLQCEYEYLAEEIWTMMTGRDVDSRFIFDDDGKLTGFHDEKDPRYTEDIQLNGVSENDYEFIKQVTSEVEYHQDLEEGDGRGDTIAENAIVTVIHWIYPRRIAYLIERNDIYRKLGRK